MAVGTEKVGSFPQAHEVSCSLPMNPRSPIPVLRSMTFTAKLVALCKFNEIAIIKPQLIPVFDIVTVEAPPHGLGMMKLDLGVFFF